MSGDSILNQQLNNSNTPTPQKPPLCGACACEVPCAYFLDRWERAFRASLDPQPTGKDAELVELIIRAFRGEL